MRLGLGLGLTLVSPVIACLVEVYGAELGRGLFMVGVRRVWVRRDEAVQSVAVPPNPTQTPTNPNPNPDPNPNPNLSAEMEPLLMMRPPCGDCSRSQEEGQS